MARKTKPAEEHDESAPGTVVLTFIFFAWFALLYLGNWWVVAQLWPFR
ncbi:MAG: hypothetical protein U0401_17270 [Anaerolineae bacterium]